MRASARVQKPIIVLDRPNPITGYLIEGPVLESSLANPDDPAPGRPGQAFALWPIPLRHGMTIGELALYYNDVLKIHADLHVVPAQGWRRDVWFDLTGLPWVKPSPNMPSLQSAILYPGLVAFESTNLSVGRGMPDAFQRVGAPWLNAAATVAILRDRDSRRALLRRELHSHWSDGRKVSGPDDSRNQDRDHQSKRGAIGSRRSDLAVGHQQNRRQQTHDRQSRLRFTVWISQSERSAASRRRSGCAD